MIYDKSIWFEAQKILFKNLPIDTRKSHSPSLVTDFISAFDEMKKDILHSFFDSKYSRDNLPDKLWRQAQLHIKDGGLGLQHTPDVAYAAYTASILDCRES